MTTPRPGPARPEAHDGPEPHDAQEKLAKPGGHQIAAASHAGIDEKSSRRERSYPFPKSHRLSLDREYQEVFRRGRRLFGERIMMHALPNDQGHHRLGLSIGRWFGIAVVRTRFKRLVREWFRLHASIDQTRGKGYDLLVHPIKPKSKGKKKGALYHRLPFKFADVSAELSHVLEQLGRNSRRGR